MTDLVECLDEKVGIISELEQKALNLLAYRAEYLIERRRQDVRDQAEEITCLGKGVLRRGAEDEEKVRRAAEREGRRSRRRRAREQVGEIGVLDFVVLYFKDIYYNKVIAVNCLCIKVGVYNTINILARV